MVDIIIKILADGLVIPIVVVGAGVLLIGIPNNQKFEAYSRILIAGLTAYLLAKLIGSIFQPESVRPFETLGVKARASFLNNPGFPSDHMLFCMAIVLAVWHTTRYKKTALVLTVAALLVGLGRILALVHTPLDVIGGVIIACIGGTWYYATPRIDKNNSLPQSGKNNKKPV